MARLLVLLLVVAVLLWWLFGRTRGRGAATSGKAAEPVTFAVCAHCGVHVPKHEAIVDGDAAYCSDAHRLAGPKDRAAP